MYSVSGSSSYSSSCMQAPSGEQRAGEEKGRSVMVTMENQMVFVGNFRSETQ